MEIRVSPGRGLGVFATKNLPRGLRIFEEEPTMHFRNERFTEKEIQEAFKKLSLEQQSEFQKLHLGTQISGRSWLKSIFLTNSFKHGTSPMLFLQSSRINHSCIPNALAAFNSNIKRQTIHLTRDVAMGEEITITYCDPHSDYEVRWQSLRTNWNFNCNCKFIGAQWFHVPLRLMNGNLTFPRRCLSTIGIWSPEQLA